MRAPWWWLVAMACSPGSVPKDPGLDTDAQASAPQNDPPPASDTGTAPSDVDSELSLKIVDVPFLIPQGEADGPLTARVTSTYYPLGELVLTAKSSRDGDLDAPVVAPDGTASLDLTDLSAGEHRITVTARAPDGLIASDDVDIGVCLWPEKQTFDTNPIGNGWQAFDNTTWVPGGGWLEITGNAQSRQGSIWKVDEEVDRGDVRIEFRMGTGNGGNTGADGYAVNIVRVNDVDELLTYIDDATNGGCLGYGIESGCGTGVLDRITAVHIEFDTWANDGNPNFDPYPHTGLINENHVAITLDGDPSNHVLFKQVDLESTPVQWHDVAVEFKGERIRVEFDGAELMTRKVPGFAFEGGYIGVTGSTGWAFNEHRFDDLQIKDRCRVPGP